MPRSATLNTSEVNAAAILGSAENLVMEVSKNYFYKLLSQCISILLVEEPNDFIDIGRTIGEAQVQVLRKNFTIALTTSEGLHGLNYQEAAERIGVMQDYLQAISEDLVHGSIRRTAATKLKIQSAVDSMHTLKEEISNNIAEQNQGFVAALYEAGVTGRRR